MSPPAPPAPRSPAPRGPSTRWRCALRGLVIGCVVLATPRPASADAPPAAEVSRFNGSFVGARVETGVSAPLPGSAVDAAGFTIGAAARLATIMQVMDVSATWQHLRSAADGRGVQQHQLAIEGRLHPLFREHLRGSRVGHTLGSVWVSLLVGAGHAARGGVADWSPAFGGGLGVDVHLRHPPRDHGLWLGVAWRAFWQRPRLDGGDRTLTHQVFSVSLELRHFGLDFLSVI